MGGFFNDVLQQHPPQLFFSIHEPWMKATFPFIGAALKEAMKVPQLKEEMLNSDALLPISRNVCNVAKRDLFARLSCALVCSCGCKCACHNAPEIYLFRDCFL